MWFLVVVILMNAALDQKAVMLKYRIELGSVPINLMDAALAVGALSALIGLFLNRSRFVTEKPHPAFVATIVLLLVTGVTGMIMAFYSGARMYDWLNGLRNLLNLPLTIAIGYYFLKAPRSTTRFAYLHVAAGVVSSFLILTFFTEMAASKVDRIVDSIRSDLFNVYPGLAAATLAYILLDRRARLFPIPLAVILLGFTLVGQFATQNRSDWLSVMGAILALPFLLPRENRGTKLLNFAVLLPTISAILIGGAFLVSTAAGRDVTGQLTRRLSTVLPTARGDDSYSRSKAWDTRLPGLLRELQLWSTSPIFGHGFGYSIIDKQNVLEDVAHNHNVWTSTLATTGLIGFVAVAFPVGAMIVIGRRMVAQAVEPGSFFIGVIAFTTAVYHIIHGAATMSFNVQRGAVALGLIAGVVFRARAIQLTLAHEYEGYLEPDQLQENADHLNPAFGY